MTTGAGNDIEQATQIARKMVTEWGMIDLLGLNDIWKKERRSFSGRDIQSNKNHSEETAKMIDEEISSIIRHAQSTSEDILKNNQELLHNMAKALSLSTKL